MLHIQSVKIYNAFRRKKFRVTLICVRAKLHIFYEIKSTFQCCCFFQKGDKKDKGNHSYLDI